MTGNTVIDALLSIASRDYTFEDERVRAAAESGRMILMTAHRRENWGEPMRDICAAVKKVLERNPEYTLLFPVHKNPIVRDIVFPELEGVDRVVLIEPPDYVPFVHMMKSAHIILTRFRGSAGRSPVAGQARAGAEKDHRAARGSRGRKREAGRDRCGYDSLRDRGTDKQTRLRMMRWLACRTRMGTGAPRKGYGR